jgi:DNA-binding NarL/FixJ family response regulator
MTDLLSDVAVLTRPTDLLICDEQPAARRSLANLLAAAPRAGTVRVVDCAGLVEAFDAGPTDLVLVGVRRRDSGAVLDPVRTLLGARPEAVVIVYGISSDAGLLSKAVAQGARGLMLWDPTRQHGPPALAALVDGHRRTPYSADALPAALTHRELQVLQGMSGGRSNNEIGRHLYLAEDTVKTHARRLFSKLGARDRAHAVALGLRHSLLT